MEEGQLVETHVVVDGVDETTKYAVEGDYLVLVRDF